MESVFGLKTSLSSIVMTYLMPKEIAYLRQMNKHHMTAAGRTSNVWYNFVSKYKQVHTCGKCKAIRSIRKMEHCSLCTKDICVEHLEICNQCDGIYCSDCRGFCC